MTSLVNSLVDEEHPITSDSIERIDVSSVIQDIKGILSDKHMLNCLILQIILILTFLLLKDCGVQLPPEEMEHIVQIAIDCLRAQLVEPEEAKRLEEEVEKAMSTEMVNNFNYKQDIASFLGNNSLVKYLQ